VREVQEETGVRARVRRLVGTYAWRMRDRWIGHIYLCVAEYVPPTFSVTAEIAEAGWWPPDALPAPINNSARLAIGDALVGNFGVLREISA
jgi:ADP-ribose pyrophosphatase YjhB (NUDIX family)